MPKFLYQCRDGSGRSDSGVLTAGDISEASRLLRRDGKAIVSLKEETAREAAATSGQPLKKVRHDDIIYFATQLAVMVDTGVPLPEALDAISEQTDHSGVKALVEGLSDDVKGGVAFSATLDKHPKVFNTLFVALMRASEASGTMGQMLQRVSDYMVQERETRNRVKGAMTYPICMLSFCAVVVVALLTFVLPKFEKIYAGKGAALPAPTQMLLSLSNFIVGYWPLLLLAIAGGVVGLVMYARTSAGRIALDHLRIKLPVIGPMYRKMYMARSLRTMATMVSTGVSMLEGLAITAEAAGNHYFSQIWLDLSERVKEGSTLADQMYGCKLIPRTVSQMIGAGERTGQLGLVMNRVAQFCEDDLKVAVKTITSLIEPVMIVVMGLLVGGIAMALLLPIFSISRVVAH